MSLKSQGKNDELAIAIGGEYSRTSTMHLKSFWSFIHGNCGCDPAYIRAKAQPIHNCQLKCASKEARIYP
jgi:hypothetical protein